MPAPNPSPPLNPAAVIDRYFLEHRAKVLDLAAFLDRVDRATAAAPDRGGATATDPRLAALRDALALLIDGRPERARRVLELWSDPTPHPIDRAGGKGAAGIWPGYGELEPGL